MRVPGASVATIYRLLATTYGNSILHAHLVRYGLPGYVGTFHSVDGIRYPRAARVICRTPRGLEVGEVLQFVEHYAAAAGAGDGWDGTLLRGVMVEDDLLIARLEQHRDEAYRECCRLLEEQRSEALLMDVEHLFDGESLYFYFLGDVPPDLDALTGPLAERYAGRVEFHRFAESLEHGCGPGCGTEAAEAGCSSGSCASCAVSQVCRQT